MTLAASALFSPPTTPATIARAAAKPDEVAAQKQRSIYLSASDRDASGRPFQFSEVALSIVGTRCSLVEVSPQTSLDVMSTFLSRRFRVVDKRTTSAEAWHIATAYLGFHHSKPASQVFQPSVPSCLERTMVS